MYGATAIRSIEVYQFRDAYESGGISEAVEYDGAIRFCCDEGRQFAIGCLLNGPGAATYLHFSEDQTVVADMLREASVRLVLE
jgi:hypothetical protein